VSNAGRPPYGVDMLDIGNDGFLISTGLLKIISNRDAENAKKLRKPPFPDFQGPFRGHESGSAVGTSRAARWLSQAQMRRPKYSCRRLD